MFLAGPQSYYCPNITKADKIRTAQYCKEHNTTFYVHAPLIANLAKTDVKKSLEVLTAELNVVQDLPAAVVLHIGKVGTIANVSAHINELINNGSLVRSASDKVPHHLLLEIAAGQGTELGRNWEEVRHLFEGLDKSMIGLCIDTQHAYAAGMSSFATHEDVVQLFQEASSIVPNGVSMIHLNDSTKTFGSRVDRHQVLRQGHIWYHDDEGLKSLVQIATDMNIDMISETPDPIADARLVRSYINDL